MDYPDIYALSDSSLELHFEKNIQITELGKLFNEKLSQRLHFEVIASHLTVNSKRVYIYIKERGLEGKMFGIVFEKTENDLHHLTDPTCATVWNTLCESLDALSLQGFNTTGKRELSLEIYDFVKRSRFAYFTDNAVYLEKKLKAEYPDVSFSFRVKDDIQYYYLIFLTDEDMRKATQKYGIENINHFVWELCKQDDPYHVFDQPLPLPVVSTKQEIIKSGAAMAIMRENLKFDTL